MRKLSLQEIRQIELTLLQHFDNFCRANNIKYYLSNGTLLGAVKYKGYIPWDDDIDILIPREEYEKLILLFEDTDEYKLWCFEKNQEYRFPFAKLCDLKTVKIEANIDNGVDLGIDIDIFPLDCWDTNLRKAKREAKLINKWMFALSLSKMYKADSVNFVKKIIKTVFIFFCKMIGSKYFIRKIKYLSIKAQTNTPLYCGCKSWCIYGTREIIPSSVFEDSLELEFEGEKFPVPLGYDTYLKSLYGKYEQDPPAEKQKTHHKYEVFAK